MVAEVAELADVFTCLFLELSKHCLIDNPDLRALEGEIELAIRLADVTHIAGTPETQKIQMSRALGLGRSAIQAMQASQASR